MFDAHPSRKDGGKVEVDCYFLGDGALNLDEFKRLKTQSPYDVQVLTCVPAVFDSPLTWTEASKAKQNASVPILKTAENETY